MAAHVLQLLLLSLTCAIAALSSGASACANIECMFGGGGAASPPPPPLPRRGGHHRGPRPGGGVLVPPPPPLTCPVNVIKIGACSPLLNADSAPDCCPLLGLLGLDIEVCLCLALNLDILGVIDINIPKFFLIASIMTTCGYSPAPNFTCP